MKMNRWLPVTLIALTSSFTVVAVTAAIADEGTRPAQSQEAGKSVEARIQDAFAKLPEVDRAAAAAQRYCPLSNTVRLGAMGTPIKVVIDGKPVFVCCQGCSDEAVEHGQETLAAAEKLKRAAAAVAKLPAADRPLAEAQLFCPIVNGSRLGGMGTPVKVMLEGQPVFVCCKPCIAKAQQNRKVTLARVEEIKKANAEAMHHEGNGHQHGVQKGAASEK